MEWILENQSWLIPLATALLANAFPAVPWGKVLGSLATALAARKHGQ